MAICKNCGDHYSDDRMEAGFDYCMDDECVAECMRPPMVVVLGVHKSNPQVVRWDSSEVTSKQSFMNR